MSKARIVQRTEPNGRQYYVIQQRHWLFRWRWVDPWVNHQGGGAYSTLEQARSNLCWYDGTKYPDRVVEERNDE